MSWHLTKASSPLSLLGNGWLLNHWSRFCSTFLNLLIAVFLFCSLVYNFARMTTCRKNENSRNRSGTEFSIIESSNYHWPFSQCCQFIKSDILMCLCNIVDQSGFQSIGLPVWNFKLSIYHFVSHGVVLLVCRSDGLSVCEFSSLSIWHSVSLWVRRSVDHLQVCRSVGQSSSQSFGLLVCPLIILSFCLVYQFIILLTRKTVSLSIHSFSLWLLRSVGLSFLQFVTLSGF